MRTAAETDTSPVGKIALADYYIVAGKTEEASALLQSMKVESAWATMVKLRLASIEYRAGRPEQASQPLRQNGRGRKHRRTRDSEQQI